MSNASSNDSPVIAILGGTQVQGSVVNHYHAPNDTSVYRTLLGHVAAGAFYNTAEQVHPARCHLGTRERVLSQLDRLAYTPANSSTPRPFTWLYASAGAGKTAIMRTFCERLDKEETKRLLASFFFLRSSITHNSASRFVATLAYQFCGSIPGFQASMERCAQNKHLVFAQNIETQTRVLLLEPMADLVRQGNPSWLSRCPNVIVIDGLDECEASSQRKDVIDTLKSLQDHFPISLSIVIASRPGHSIKSQFASPTLRDKTTLISLDGDLPSANADIRKFLEDQFLRISEDYPLSRFLPRSMGEGWPSRAIIDRLVDKASGQFIYAATIIRFVDPEVVLSTRSTPDERLQMVLGTLPPHNLEPLQELNALYRGILQTVRSEDLEDLRLLFGVIVLPHGEEGIYTPHLSGQIVCLPSSFDSSRINTLLGWHPERCDSLLAGLESLVATDNDKGAVRIYHKSFVDFLLDPERSGIFHIAKGRVCERLARRFIRMQFHHTQSSIRLFMLANINDIITHAEATRALCEEMSRIDVISVENNARAQLSPKLVAPEVWWCRIFSNFLRGLRHSKSEQKQAFYRALVGSFQSVLARRLKVHERIDLRALLYLSCRHPPPEFDNKARKKLVSFLIHSVPEPVLSEERAYGFHLTLPAEHTTHLLTYSSIPGPLSEFMENSLPPADPRVSYFNNFYTALVDWVLASQSSPALLTKSKFLRCISDHLTPTPALLEKLRQVMRKSTVLSPEFINMVRDFELECSSSM